ADREHVRDRASRNHAEEGGTDHRDLCRAAAKAAHSGHRDIREEVGAAGACENLAEDGERDDNEDRDLKDVADGAVNIEAEISDHAFGRDIARLKIARQMRADVNINRDTG